MPDSAGKDKGKMNATMVETREHFVSETKDVSVTRLTIPVLLVIGVVSLCLTAGFTVGSLLTRLDSDKQNTENRLTAIEKELIGLKSLITAKTDCLRLPTQKSR